VCRDAAVGIDRTPEVQSGENIMLGWAIFFFLLAIVAAIFGFGGVAAMAVDIAQILFVVFIVLFVLTLVVHVLRGRGPPPP
jgi:uncharacterized membrane protein YtjA (UPF0391 family)